MATDDHRMFVMWVHENPGCDYPHDDWEKEMADMDDDNKSIPFLGHQPSHAKAA